MAIKWSDEGDNSLWLITPAEFEKLPDGIELEAIDNTVKVKGQDIIDQDVRFGHIAWGIRNPFNGKYKDELLLILLANNNSK